MLDRLPPWMQQAALQSRLPAWMQDPPPKKKQSLLSVLGEAYKSASEETTKLPVLGRLLAKMPGDARKLVKDLYEHPAGMIGPGELGVAAPEARAAGSALLRRLLEPGGATLTKAGEHFAGSGYMVADPKLTLKTSNPAEIAKFIKRADVKAALKTGGHFGKWVDPETGVAEINISHPFESKADALKIARQRKEKAIGHIVDGEYQGDIPSIPPKIGTPAIRVHVPGEKEPRIFTGPAHSFARNDAEDALGDLLDKNFEPRFQIDDGYLADDMKTWLSREEGLASAKYHKQLGGNAKAVEAVKRSGQLKSEALKQPDAYATARDLTPEPVAASATQIPAQDPLRYYVGLRTPESKLDQARELAYKAFRPKGKYGKLAARGEKVKGAPDWYDTRKLFEEAEAAAPGSGAQQMNEILNMMAASTARSEPKNNLQRGIMWSVLNRLKMLEPEALRSGEKFPVPPKFGHMFQRRTHQPLVANVVEHGGLNPLSSPKGASFGGRGPHGTGNLGLNWRNPTIDDVMSKVALEQDPRLAEFFATKLDPRLNGFTSPRPQFYGPIAEGFTQAAEEAFKQGRVPLPDPALHPTAAYQAMGWMGKSPSASKGSIHDIFGLLRDESADMWGVSPEEATRLLFKEQRPFLLPLDYRLGGR